MFVRPNNVGIITVLLYILIKNKRQNQRHPLPHTREDMCDDDDKNTICGGGVVAMPSDETHGDGASSGQPPLAFVHTPKCGGTYVGSILRDLNVRNVGHRHLRAKERLCFTSFTVIREPTARFESLLNFRLGPRCRGRRDWPEQLKHAFRDPSVTLDDVVDQMSDDDMRGFVPFRSLVYWSVNVDVVLTMEQLHAFLTARGYTYDRQAYPRSNVSTKRRGTLSEANGARIRRVFSADVELFERVARQAPSTIS